jgi:hypothetical protein
MLGAALPCAAAAQEPTVGVREGGLHEPPEPDPYAFVRGLLGASRNEAGKALCEQHIAVVQQGLPDPGRYQGSGSRFAQTAQRAELLQMLFLGARKADDPSAALAHVLVLIGMLEGASYPDALSKMIALEAAQETREFDCAKSYAVQALPPVLDKSPSDVDFERDRQRYLVACADELPSEQLRDEQSWALELILSSVEQVYGERLIPGGGKKPLGARSEGDRYPPRYVATWRDRDGNMHTQPLTGGFLGDVEHAYTSGDRRKAAIDGVNRAADIWNGAMGIASRRFPVAGIASAPSGSIFGTVTSAIENLNGAVTLAGKSAPGLAATARAAGWLGLVIQALESDSTATPTQEGATSLSMLHPDREAAQPVDVRRSNRC